MTPVVWFFAGVAASQFAMALSAHGRAVRVLGRVSRQTREDMVIEEHIRRRAETARLTSRGVA